MAGGKDFPSGGVAQNPFQGMVSSAPEIGGNAHPIKVHVHGECGGGRVVCQAALLETYFRERHASPAEFLGQGQQQILRSAELLKVFLEEAVFAVVGCGTGGESCKLFVAKNLARRVANCCGGIRVSRIGGTAVAPSIRAGTYF